LSTAFQPQMLAWAATGSPFIDPSADDKIHVSFIAILGMLKSNIVFRLCWSRSMIPIMLRTATRQD
jgi:hypothetical protein